MVETLGLISVLLMLHIQYESLKVNLRRGIFSSALPVD